MSANYAIMVGWSGPWVRKPIAANLLEQILDAGLRSPAGIHQALAR
jgi:hypothetical protein